MPANGGVNRVFLEGTLEGSTWWEINYGHRFFCFTLKTTESHKRGQSVEHHIELHHIKVPADLIRDESDFLHGQVLFVQGKITTRPVFENNIKLYRCEIVVNSVSISSLPVISL